MYEVNRTHFRFYGELNAFLPPERRGRSFAVDCNGRVAVKHQIEALGAPHTEVDLILADGDPVGFDHILVDGQRVAVYPSFRSLELTGIPPLRSPLERPARFILDVHLGQLASYLRLLGCDTRYAIDLEDAALAKIAHDEGRVLVTRDHGLLKRRQVVYGCCLWSRDPWEQLLNVALRYGLWREFRPWSRCLRCNGLLRSVPKEAVEHQLQPKTRRTFDDFRQCAACNQVYWHGSHAPSLMAVIERVMALDPDGPPGNS